MDKSLIWKFCFVRWVFVLQCFDCRFLALRIITVGVFYLLQNEEKKQAGF